MTYVLGARCVDGVVLVADRQVSYEDGATVKFEPKISREKGGFFVGYSGSDITNLNFRYKLSNAIDEFVKTEKGKLSHSKRSQLNWKIS
jgi:20S proteasome alpha/beta subunit